MTLSDVQSQLIKELTEAGKKQQELIAELLATVEIYLENGDPLQSVLWVDKDVLEEWCTKARAAD